MDGVATMAEQFRKEKAEREKEREKAVTAGELKDALAQFAPPPKPTDDPKPKDDPPKQDDPKPKDDEQDDNNNVE